MIKWRGGAPAECPLRRGWGARGVRHPWYLSSSKNYRLVSSISWLSDSLAELLPVQTSLEPSLTATHSSLYRLGMCHAVLQSNLVALACTRISLVPVHLSWKVPCKQCKSAPCSGRVLAQSLLRVLSIVPWFYPPKVRYCVRFRTYRLLQKFRICQVKG